MSSRRAGVWWIVLSATGFGAMAIFAKLAYRDGVTTPTMLLLRFSIAGVLLAAWCAAHRLRWPRGRDLVVLAAMGAVGYVGQAYCYFTALQYASAGLVALLLYLYPAIVTVLSGVLYRRPIGMGRVVAVGVALLGMALAVGGDLRSEWTGVLLGVGAAVIYSGYILAGEGVMARVDSLSAAAVVMLAAATVYGAAAVPAGLALPQSWLGWAAVLAIAVFSTLLAIVGFFKGLAALGAADASTLSTLEPVVTILLAAVFLGESATPMQMLGGALILVVVVYLTRRPPTAQPDLPHGSAPPAS